VKSREIDGAIRNLNSAYMRALDLLLVGAGDSGKSTVAKQMKVLFLDGFTNDEIDYYKHVIYQNIIDCYKEIYYGLTKFGYKVEGLKEDFEIIISKKENELTNCSSSFLKTLKNIWENDHVQKFYNNDRSKVQLMDSCKFYLDDLDRILAEDFSPNEQDVLRSRQKTNGIIETPFKIQTLNFKIIDVGGQRSERRKWINIFDKVKSILFCTSLSEYNQFLYEDESVGRMAESLKLFHELVNNHIFEKTPIILFLNKVDIFKEKLPKFPFSNYVTEYEGDNTYEQVSEYIKNKFLSVVLHEKKR